MLRGGRPNLLQESDGLTHEVNTREMARRGAARRKEDDVLREKMMAKIDNKSHNRGEYEI